MSCKHKLIVRVKLKVNANDIYTIKINKYILT